MQGLHLFLTLGVLHWALLTGVARAGIAPGHIEFNRDVRPIITENCYACHGPDKNQRKAKLRLDVRQIALERGAIVPGKPAESKLVDHVFSSDPDDVMPPPKTQKKLTPAQKDLLKEWIAQGAEYEPHWAYMPLKRPAVPATREPQWVRNPIDGFILHTLESKEIRPSAEADKSTLLRRLSLDLIGLPPTAEELQRFLHDKSPSAYERQVDRLLVSPHFGERMAVPWLDVVRFADTVGYHGDQNVNIFPYRDYVIDSFNRNKPFDQFTVEQIAGDLLPRPTLEQRVATGFNRLNMVTREGGAQPKEYLAKYAADRVRTVSMAWLGSTMGCAECHDHKYDPFASKDFYQMEAFFADIKQWGVYMDYDYTPNPDLKGFSNDHPFPPEIRVNSPYLQHRITRLTSRQNELCAGAAAKLKADSKASAAYEDWRKTSLLFFKQWPSGWAVPVPEVQLKMKDTNAVAATNFSSRGGGWVDFSPEPKEELKVRLSLGDQWVSAIRLEVVPFPDASDKQSSDKKWKGSSVSLEASLKPVEGTNDTRLTFYHAEADHKKERYENGFSIIGIKDRWDLSKEDENQTGVWLLDQPFKADPGSTLEVDLKHLTVASTRVSVSPFAAFEPLDAGGGLRLHRALEKKLMPRKDDRELLEKTYLLSATADTEELAEVRKVLTDIRECRNGLAWTLVTEPRAPLVTRVLPRGNWQNESGDVVQPLVPHFLPQIPNPDGRRLTRLDLAEWLVSPENPLTARAVMNRLWKQFFGTGISAIVDDLGAQGEWPVHPELLDWLACEFIHPSSAPSPMGAEPGVFPWDFKHMVRLVVMSSTYRQDSNQRPELKDIDPNNRLLAGQSPRRLEAEFVRDNALAIAGLLNEDLGGPSVFPYQPAGYYSYLQFPDRDYYPSKDDRQYRRGVYAHWQRTFLHPMLANFDAPSREECCANRVVSDTPQQALTLLNDPTFVEAARAFATKLLAGPAQSEQDRLAEAFKQALARAPRKNESRSLLEFLAIQEDHYRQDPAETKKLMHVGLTPPPQDVQQTEVAAWTQVCRVILNLHETITRY